VSSSGNNPLRNYPNARLAPVIAHKPAPADLDRVTARKERFDRLNADIREMGGWIISIAGDRRVTVECLPDSVIPERLRDAGFKLAEIDGGQRILTGSVIERLELSSSGAFIPMTEGSTKPVHVRRHAGIAPTRRFSFDMG
jgi:hypothetical protein